ncbi:MAG: hypothetical protein H6743_04905 [Rickettsiaceae bacterium]|nr:hypothetical protein [Rickettsiaceae bacterium]
MLSTNHTNRMIFALSIFAIIMFQNCNNSVEPKPPDEEEISRGIQPLKVGYFWTYRDYYLREDGSINNDIPYTEFKSLIRTTSSITINNENYVVFNQTWTLTENEIYSPLEWLYKNFDDGLYLMGGKRPNDSIFTKLLRYKYPIQKGEIWESPLLVYDPMENNYLIQDTLTYTCIDTSAIFETPIGNFSCFVYYHREDLDEDVSAKADIYEYYSKDVGLVGRITYSYFEFDQTSFPNSKRVLFSTNIFTN